MPLSPIDVQQQTFKLSLRGYAEDEVDEFLDEVVISLRDYEQRLRDSQERVAVLEEQMSASRETEDAMRRTFIAAQRTADTIVEEAKAESARMLEEAGHEVAKVAGEQSEEKARLLAETSRVRDQVAALRTALTALVDDGLTRLDSEGVEVAADEILQSENVSADESSEAMDEDERDATVDLSDPPESDVEIAKVPDWMTDNSDSIDDVDSIDFDSAMEGSDDGETDSAERDKNRRPWERSDD